MWTLKQGHLRLSGTSPAPLSLLGIALSSFLGFRNTACYDRWWEARKQWGALLIDLPLLALSRTAEINLLEALGEPQPEPLRPKDFILE